MNTTQQEFLEFHKLFCELSRALGANKNTDYAHPDDAFANFKMFGIKSALQGIVFRLGDKLQRLMKHACNVKLAVSDETHEDTCKDIVNYAILYAALSKEISNISRVSSVPESLVEAAEKKYPGVCVKGSRFYKRLAEKDRALSASKNTDYAQTLDAFAKLCKEITETTNSKTIRVPESLVEAAEMKFPTSVIKGAVESIKKLSASDDIPNGETFKDLTPRAWVTKKDREDRCNHGKSNQVYCVDCDDDYQSGGPDED